MHRKILLALLVFSLLAGTASAQQQNGIDTVIIASTANYPDALVASAASAHTGSPILLTGSSELDQGVRNALSRMQPSDVVLVGGPAVISDQVASELAQEYNVTRLWGATRYGTASDIAEYFWPAGSDEAILVQNEMDDERGNVLAAAKGLARQRGIPVYLSQEDGIPAAVLSSMKSLGITSVTVIGDLEDESRTQLSEIGASVDEVISAPDEEQLEQRVREQLRQRLNVSKEFVVVASNSFQHSIAAIGSPESNSYRVGSTDNVAELVSFLQNEGIDTVKVVGQPQLAEDVANRLEQENITVDLRVAQAAEARRIANNVSSKGLEQLRRIHKRLAAHIQQRLEQHEEAVQRRANNSIARAENLVDQFGGGEDAQEAIRKAKDAYDNGEYAESMKMAKEAIEEVRERRWEDISGNYTRVQEEIREETADIREATQNLARLNQAFGRQMSENMTVKERLEIISEFREKRREAVQDIIEEAQSLGGGDLTGRLDRARKRISTGFRQDVELNCAEEDAPAPGNTSVEFDDGEDYTGVEGDVGLNTPNYRPQASADVSREQRTVQFRLAYQPRDGFGVQCTGASAFELRQRVPVSGEWDVGLTITVDGEQIYQDSQTVSVAADDDVQEAPEQDDDEFQGNETHAAPTETSDDDSDQAEEHVVQYSSDGFSPQSIQIVEGDTVVWRSQEGAPSMNVASNQHPTHTQYDGTSRRQHCGAEAEEDVFDSCGSRQEYRFTFDKEGTWNYHNHDLASHGGVVVVQDDS